MGFLIYTGNRTIEKAFKEDIEDLICSTSICKFFRIKECLICCARETSEERIYKWNIHYINGSRGVLYAHGVVKNKYGHNWYEGKWFECRRQWIY